MEAVPGVGECGMPSAAGTGPSTSHRPRRHGSTKSSPRFAESTRKKPQRGAHHSVAELNEDSTSASDAHNAQQKPYRWSIRPTISLRRSGGSTSWLTNSEQAKNSYPNSGIGKLGQRLGPFPKRVKFGQFKLCELQTLRSDGLFKRLKPAGELSVGRPEFRLRIKAEMPG